MTNAPQPARHADATGPHDFPNPPCGSSPAHLERRTPRRPGQCRGGGPALRWALLALSLNACAGAPAEVPAEPAAPAPARVPPPSQDSVTEMAGEAAPPGESDSDELAPPRVLTVDPGDQPWKPVPRDEVRETCGLAPELLDQADARLNLRWGLVRRGRLCHEFYPAGESEATTTHVFSATKTMGAVVAGMVMYQTRDLPDSETGAGPVHEFQRIDRWLDPETLPYDLHPDSTIAHVLAMVAYNDDLGFGAKAHAYDADGSREINSLNDLLNNALAQSPEDLGDDLESFTQRHLFGPLGMRHSTWNDGASEKVFAFSWNTSVRDMLRLGLLINNGGIWNEERLLDTRYVYNMIHPAFEDGNTGYGYLTWLNGADHRPPVVGTLLKNPLPADGCAPLAVHRSYPHGISAAESCNYTSGTSCNQRHDVGTWSAQGLNGNYIYGHRGLDMVLVIQDYGTLNLHPQLWDLVRPALVAEDPDFRGDETAFCAAYAAGDHAPDLRLWEGGM